MRDMAAFRTARNRDAWPSIRGFLYQAALSIDRWLSLGRLSLWSSRGAKTSNIVRRALEAEEDEESRLLEQVKVRDTTVSLRSGPVVEYLANALEHTQANPGLQLAFRFLTNGRLVVPVRGKKEGGMVVTDQLHQWQSQLADEPSSFARDLATVVLLELERLQRDAAEGHRRFALMQAALIRPQLAIHPPQCPACGDGAALQVAERLRRGGMRREARGALPWKSPPQLTRGRASRVRSPRRRTAADPRGRRACTSGSGWSPGLLRDRVGHRRPRSLVHTTTHELEQSVDTEWLPQQRVDLQVRRDVFGQCSGRKTDRRSGPGTFQKVSPTTALARMRPRFDSPYCFSASAPAVVRGEFSVVNTRSDRGGSVKMRPCDRSNADTSSGSKSPVEVQVEDALPTVLHEPRLEHPGSRNEPRLWEHSAC